MILKFYFTLYLISLSSCLFMKNKYTVDMEAGFLCPDNDDLEVPMRLYRIDRINRTHRAFSIDYTYVRPLDENTEGAMFLERWGDGGWLNMPNLPWQKDPCKYGMRTGKDIMIRLGKAVGLKHPDRCPIPAGNYSLHRYPIRMDYDIPFWSGRFKVRLVTRRIENKKKMFCVESIINVVEKFD